MGVEETANQSETETKDCGLYAANMLIQHWRPFTNLGASPPKRITIYEPSLIHTSDVTSDDTLPQPPQNEFKNPYPHTWSKNACS